MAAHVLLLYSVRVSADAEASPPVTKDAWQHLVVHPYVSALLDLRLPPGHWALFGSGPLLLRGWIDDVGDLDVLSRGPAWDAARRHGLMTRLPDGNEIVEVEPGVTIGHTWPYDTADIDEMIDTSEMIEGVPCVRLEYLKSYMRLFDRPKDRERLAVIASKEQ